jgi:hypothetical protein
MTEVSGAVDMMCLGSGALGKLDYRKFNPVSGFHFFIRPLPAFLFGSKVSETG